MLGKKDYYFLSLNFNNILFSWHPKRNEILTCSWDYSVNINGFKDKFTERPCSPSSFSGRSFLDDEDQDLMDVRPPLRRSRRIAQRSATTPRRN